MSPKTAEKAVQMPEGWVVVDGSFSGSNEDGLVVNKRATKWFGDHLKEVGSLTDEGLAQAAQAIEDEVAARAAWTPPAEEPPPEPPKLGDNPSQPEDDPMLAPATAVEVPTVEELRAAELEAAEKELEAAAKAEAEAAAKAEAAAAKEGAKK
jgi:hypothetical protein